MLPVLRSFTARLALIALLFLSHSKSLIGSVAVCVCLWTSHACRIVRNAWELIAISNADWETEALCDYHCSFQTAIRTGPEDKPDCRPIPPTSNSIRANLTYSDVNGGMWHNQHFQINLYTHFCNGAVVTLLYSVSFKNRKIIFILLSIIFKKKNKTQKMSTLQIKCL